MTRIKKTPVYRAYCLTSYEPEITFPNSLYSIVGKEICPKTKRPHLQCYVYYKNGKSFSKMKKLFPKAHIEYSKGTPVENRKYCSKDGVFTETGKLPKQGNRTDLEEIYDMAKKGESDTAIGEAFPGHYMKYYKAIDRVKFNYAQLDTKFENVQVHVLMGSPGVGKSRRAHEAFPDIYTVDVQKDKIWFDGYNGQQAILLDDYEGEIDYRYLLRLLDGYKFAIPIKGGYVWKQWKHVYITTNIDPEYWYRNKDYDPLERRITSVEKL